MFSLIRSNLLDALWQRTFFLGCVTSAVDCMRTQDPQRRGARRSSCLQQLFDVWRRCLDDSRRYFAEDATSGSREYTRAHAVADGRRGRMPCNSIVVPFIARRVSD
jgi:hypothetical protein